MRARPVLRAMRAIPWAAVAPWALLYYWALALCYALGAGLL